LWPTLGQAVEEKSVVLMERLKLQEDGDLALHVGLAFLTPKLKATSHNLEYRQNQD
jgi:hypothetical protein